MENFSRIYPDWFDYRYVTTIIIEDQVENIGSCSFSSSPVSSVSIRAGVEIIGNLAFYGCGSLKMIQIPNTVQIIGNQAFGKTALKSVEIPSGVTTIGDGVFFQCYALTTITVPNLN